MEKNWHPARNAQLILRHNESQCLVIGRSLVLFPWSACRSVLRQDTEPQTAPDVAPCMAAASMNVWMNYCKSFWTKASDKYYKYETRSENMEASFSTVYFKNTWIVNAEGFSFLYWCFVQIETLQVKQKALWGCMLVRYSGREWHANMLTCYKDNSIAYRFDNVDHLTTLSLCVCMSTRSRL